MFHLLVSYNGWKQGRDTISSSRVFESTDQALVKRFKPDGELDSTLIARIPALFVSEINGPGDQHAHIGTIFSAGVIGHDVVLEYAWDPAIDSIPNTDLQHIASELSIADQQFSRTHWSIKSVDLFKTLLRSQSQSRPRTSAFKLADPAVIENDLISVMMPFASDFKEVYEAIQHAAREVSMRCNRADDIWIHPTIIQDVVSLIDRSRIVVCDCTGRNPNVFYEIGIAHTLGRDVVLITQSDADIPFDLRHFRYIKYLNNSEGLKQLQGTLAERLRTLANRMFRA